MKKYIDVDKALNSYVKENMSSNEYLATAMCGVQGLPMVEIQEAKEPCEFCEKFNFSGAKAEVDKYGAHIKLAGGLTGYGRDEQFNYCPVCGRLLK